MSDVSHENDTQCRVCLRCFVHPQACYQHRQATGHHVHQFPHKCDSCVRRFETETACFQHMDALGHWVWPSCCETCTARFKYDIHCENHMREHDHYHKPYHCPTCQQAWRTCNERDQNQASTGHYGHLHCADGDRYFQTAGNLDQHRKSRIHQGTTVRCPFCDDAFVTASGLSHYIETSACPEAKNLDRQKVWQFLRERDPQGGFTERLLTYPGSKLGAEWNPASAWNGSCFQCYICGKEYQTPNMLRQHVMSPVHQAPIYHCPNKNGKCGGKKFSSLAAFFNHLESESCAFMKFHAVLRGVSNLFNGDTRPMGFS